MDNIIAEVNNAGVSIIPQSEFKKNLVSSMNLNTFQDSVNDLKSFYNIQALNGDIDFKDFNSKKSIVQNILEDKNTFALDGAFESEGGVKNVINQNKKFFDTLDYEGTLDLYRIYLKEKNGLGVFYDNAEFVSKQSIEDLKDLQINKNPNKLADIVKEIGGIESLVNKTANAISETNEFYDQRKAITLGPKIVENGLDYSAEFSKFDSSKTKDNNIKIKNTIKLN